jgi:nucleotide-binding universal stress UspA family protein
VEAERLLDSMRIEASFNVVAKEGQTVGHRILSEVDKIGADSLVMGAYRHGAAFEWVLGGATADVLSHTHVPVWLLH